MIPLDSNAREIGCLEKGCHPNGMTERSEGVLIRRPSHAAFAPFFLSGYCEGMTVEAIKDAIVALPLEERQSLVSWLNELEYDAWDKQMVEDFSPGGRGAALLEKVKREIAEGKTISLQEGRARAKARRD